MKHKHRDLIIAWADGATIEYKPPQGVWHITKMPGWDDCTEYRVMPKPNKELLVRFAFDHILQEPVCSSIWIVSRQDNNDDANVKFTFDGETGEFLKAEKL